MKKTEKIKSKLNATRRKKECVYNSNDFNSNDGMLTAVWGPSMWHYLHTMSFNYPVNPTKEDKKHYKEFILNLQYVLPCGKCRKNLKKNFKKLPLLHKHMESRLTFSRYIYDLHETVNKMLDKKSILTYEQVRERYEHFRARCAYTDEDIKNIMIEKKKALDEKGCTEPLYGEKSRCILQIVPQTNREETLQIDEKCVKHKIHTI